MAVYASICVFIFTSTCVSMHVINMFISRAVYVDMSISGLNSTHGPYVKLTGSTMSVTHGCTHVCTRTYILLPVRVICAGCMDCYRSIDVYTCTHMCGYSCMPAPVLYGDPCTHGSVWRQLLPAGAWWEIPSTHRRGPGGRMSATVSHHVKLGSQPCRTQVPCCKHRCCMHTRTRAFVSVPMCACVRVRVCMRACVCMSMRACV